MDSVVLAPRLQSTGSIVEHGLSCSAVCRIFLHQGLNWCVLHWQADSLPLSHQLLFSCSAVSDSLQPHGLQHARLPCSSPSPSRLLKLLSIESVMPSHPFSSCLQSFLASGSFLMSQLFTSDGQSIGASALASNEYSGLISFRIDQFDHLAVQGKLKSLLQHQSLKASIFWHSAFFMVQFSHPYMTIGKTIALTRWTFVGRVTTLLFNMLSRFVITFLLRSK